MTFAIKDIGTCLWFTWLLGLISIRLHLTLISVLVDDLFSSYSYLGNSRCVSRITWFSGLFQYVNMSRHLLMVHLTLRTHSHTLASYSHHRTCWWLLYILPVSWDFSMCLSYYLILRTFSIFKHVQQTFLSWIWYYFGTSLVLPDSQDFFNM